MYICIPPVYEKTGKYCKLRKVLYGIKQSLRVWFDKLRIVMRSIKYKQGNNDHTLFIKYDGEKINILLVYVDDMVIVVIMKNR